MRMRKLHEEDARLFEEEAEKEEAEEETPDEVDLSDLDDGSVDDGSFGSNKIVAYDDEDAQEAIDDDDIDAELDDEEKAEIESMIMEMAELAKNQDLDEAKKGKYPKSWLWRTTKKGHKIAFDTQGRVVAGNPHVVKWIHNKKKKAGKARRDKRYYEKNKARLNAKRAERRRSKKLAASYDLTGMKSVRDEHGRTVSFMGESIYLDNLDKEASRKLSDFISRVSTKSKSSLYEAFDVIDKHVSKNDLGLATAIIECIGESEKFEVQKVPGSYCISLDRDIFDRYRALSESAEVTSGEHLASTKFKDGVAVSLRNGNRTASGMSEIRIFFEK